MFAKKSDITFVKEAAEREKELYSKLQPHQKVPEGYKLVNRTQDFRDFLRGFSKDCDESIPYAYISPEGNVLYSGRDAKLDADILLEHGYWFVAKGKEKKEVKNLSFVNAIILCNQKSEFDAVMSDDVYGYTTSEMDEFVLEKQFNYDTLTGNNWTVRWKE